MSIISDSTVKSTLDGTEKIPIGGGYFHALVSGVKDYVLTFFSNKTTLDSLTAADSNLQYGSVDVNLGLRKSTNTSKSADFTVSTGANCLLLWAYIHRGSNPITFTIGTTVEGAELLEETTLSGGETFPFIKFLTGATIYVTITDGDGDFEFMYIKNYHT